MRKGMQKRSSKEGSGSSLLKVLVPLIVVGFVVAVAQHEPGQVSVGYAADVEQRAAPHRSVRYVVTGTASEVDVTYSLGDGGTEQIAAARLPWSRDLRARADASLYVSAQNATDAGKVVVSIWIDGEIAKTAASEGAYVIAATSY